MAANKSRNGQNKPNETGTQTESKPGTETQTDPKPEQQSKPDGETQTNPDPQTNPDDDNTPTPEPSETVTALALVDHGPFNLRCGYVCRVPAESAEQLEADGVIDTHEKAVASGQQSAEEEGSE